MSDLLTGKLTRLVAADPDKLGERYALWSRDSEFMQLFDTHAPIVRDVKKTQEWFRKEAEKERPGAFGFGIECREDGRLIGMTGLWDVLTPHRNAWLSIAIGERELWGKGYGSDALTLVLQYGFCELNLRRVTLVTFEMNPRAIRAYEKAGFVHEGRQRGAMKRSGQRTDLFFMGILKDEWARMQAGESEND